MITNFKACAPTAAFVLVALMATAPQAHADIILEGDTNGSYFDSLACTSCVGTSINGAGDDLTFGSTASGSSPSHLFALDTSISVDANPGDVINNLLLAQLQLTVGNKPGVGQTGVTFDWNVKFTFTTPAFGPSDQDLSLGISGIYSPPTQSVTISGLDASGFSDLSLMYLSFSNFSFLNVGVDGNLSGTNWTVSGNSKTATLQLLATLTVAACQENDRREACSDGPPGPNEIPEPTTLALFGAGLFGYGLVRRRRRKPGAELNAD